MSGLPIRWAVAAYGGPCHALAVAEVDAAPSRGWAVTLCGLTLPAGGLAPSPAPAGAALCFPCASLVASEVPEQRDPFL